MKGDGRGMIYFSSSVSHLSQSLISASSMQRLKRRSHPRFKENPTKIISRRNELTLSVISSQLLTFNSQFSIYLIKKLFLQIKKRLTSL
jgi:hypothetical protein